MNRSILAVCLLAACLAILAVAPASSSAWAPAAKATVHPGVQTYTAGAQCTANFIFSDAAGTYIGQAAHCAGTGAATETDGCDARSRPLGTSVEIDGATRPGKLVYSSWRTMQAKRETNPNACAYNDFALVRIAPADVAKVNPSVPGYGGPVGVGGPSARGDSVFSYGNSSLRLGVTFLSPKEGVVVETEGNGWSRTVYTVIPGIPGDSGSGFLNDTGGAIGTLSTVAILPAPASNGVGDLARELNYMRAHSSFSGVRLVKGTRPFTPDTVGAIIEGAG